MKIDEKTLEIKWQFQMQQTYLPITARFLHQNMFDNKKMHILGSIKSKASILKFDK